MAEDRARPSGARLEDFNAELEERFVMVYELWSDSDLEWVEFKVNQLELAKFLESWCRKNDTIFRRATPFLRPRTPRARQSRWTHEAS